jgi:hypothetical protein
MDVAQNNNCSGIDDEDFKLFYRRTYAKNNNVDIDDIVEDQNIDFSAVVDAYNIWNESKNYSLNKLLEYFKKHIPDQDAITGLFLHNQIEKYIREKK